MSKLREKMVRDLTIRGFAESTIRQYPMRVEQFLRETKIKDLGKVDVETILDYQHSLLEKRKLSPQTVNQNIAALRFLFITTLGRPWNPSVFPFVPVKKRVPLILSLNEIASLLNAVDDLQDRTLLLTLYCAGVRPNEGVHLKAQDIHSDRSLVHVQFGKGGKTRYTLLPPLLLHALRYYWKQTPELDKSQWLFPDRKRPELGAYAHRLRRVFARAIKKVGLQKKVTLHTLRHCFATHLLENGVDLRYIQVLLGHSQISTTTIYSHVRESQFKELTSPVGSFAQKLNWLPIPVVNPAAEAPQKQTSAA
jgi:site-specific recombinase XerD